MTNDPTIQSGEDSAKDEDEATEIPSNVTLIDDNDDEIIVAEKVTTEAIPSETELTTELKTELVEDGQDAATQDNNEEDIKTDESSKIFVETSGTESSPEDQVDGLKSDAQTLKESDEIHTEVISSTETVEKVETVECAQGETTESTEASEEIGSTDVVVKQDLPLEESHSPEILANANHELQTEVEIRPTEVEISSSSSSSAASTASSCSSPSDDDSQKHEKAIETIPSESTIIVPNIEISPTSDNEDANKDDIAPEITEVPVEEVIIATKIESHTEEETNISLEKVTITEVAHEESLENQTVPSSIVKIDYTENPVEVNELQVDEMVIATKIESYTEEEMMIEHEELHEDKTVTQPATEDLETDDHEIEQDETQDGRISVMVTETPDITEDVSTKLVVDVTRVDGELQFTDSMVETDDSVEIKAEIEEAIVPDSLEEDGDKSFSVLEVMAKTETNILASQVEETFQALETETVSVATEDETNELELAKVDTKVEMTKEIVIEKMEVQQSVMVEQSHVSDTLQSTSDEISSDSAGTETKDIVIMESTMNVTKVESTIIEFSQGDITESTTVLQMSAANANVREEVSTDLQTNVEVTEEKVEEVIIATKIETNNHQLTIR